MGELHRGQVEEDRKYRRQKSLHAGILQILRD